MSDLPSLLGSSVETDSVMPQERPKRSPLFDNLVVPAPYSYRGMLDEQQRESGQR